MLLRHGAHVDQTPLIATAPSWSCCSPVAPTPTLLMPTGTQHSQWLPCSELVELLLEHGAHVEQHD